MCFILVYLHIFDRGCLVDYLVACLFVLNVDIAFDLSYALDVEC